jgi:uncharacterized protein (UPF0371 family)
MNSNESIKYRKAGFDNNKYLEVQSTAINRRVEKFSKGRMYLEVGGKLLFDAHASRVLPGFDPENKIKIFKKFEKQMDIIFCVNAHDIANNRKLYNFNQGYIKSTTDLILKIQKVFKSNIFVSINLVDDTNFKYAMDFKELMASKGIRSFFRYIIKGYPKGKKVLTIQGFGLDEYIPVSKDLVIVTGAASNSGKMSTCLGQIYLESLNSESSGYAKYETFPIWNLNINHPINLAYEAATADIGDYNQIDSLHMAHHKIHSVNYNRDVQAFGIIRDFSNNILNHSNYMFNYKSPTDMGISNAGFCISDENICIEASIEEIKRRIEWYKETKDRDAIIRCKELLEKCEKYILKNSI